MNNQDRVVIEFMIYFSVSSFFNLNGSILGFRSLALFCHKALLFLILCTALARLLQTKRKSRNHQNTLFCNIIYYYGYLDLLQRLNQSLGAPF